MIWTMFVCKKSIIHKSIIYKSIQICEPFAFSSMVCEFKTWTFWTIFNILTWKWFKWNNFDLYNMLTYNWETWLHNFHPCVKLFREHCNLRDMSSDMTNLALLFGLSLLKKIQRKAKVKSSNFKRRSILEAFNY